MSLKKTIENTLINNLEIYKPFIDDPFTSEINYESIERCSDYIAKEMKEAMKVFAQSYGAYIRLMDIEQVPYRSTSQLLDQFIADRYKEDKQ